MGVPINQLVRMGRREVERRERQAGMSGCCEGDFAEKLFLSSASATSANSIEARRLRREKKRGEQTRNYGHLRRDAEIRRQGRGQRLRHGKKCVNDSGKFMFSDVTAAKRKTTETKLTPHTKKANRTIAQSSSSSRSFLSFFLLL